ncbi:phosphate ABC transporter substrate-binding protein [Aestuariibacter sp. AA17]|uniref:Phosphate ABC transporter substrate-binding protein n=1 Tax=Fluctibacter corallii TaxID=2984329 RepID=A0ABT3A351_9ALTE|nr:phosphate ABC transporter substrate-binding protein [Aestuariibacter sp. AA17]MCV2883116.1 phosphate ABC transporter substrate-binding protein [Aestuariibacter sp. AA17]
MKYALTLFSLLMVSFTSSANVSIITHAENTLTLSNDVIERIFLGKQKTLPSGHTIVPITMEEALEDQQTFNSTVLNKSSSQLKAYWSKLIFTGKGTPPKAVSTKDEMLELISTNPNMIGYVVGAVENHNVNVVATY